MANALSLLLDAGSAAGTVRDAVTGSTLLRALGGICGMRATEGRLGWAVVDFCGDEPQHEHGSEVDAGTAASRVSGTMAVCPPC